MGFEGTADYSTTPTTALLVTLSLRHDNIKHLHMWFTGVENSYSGHGGYATMLYFQYGLDYFFLWS